LTSCYHSDILQSGVKLSTEGKKMERKQMMEYTLMKLKKELNSLIVDIMQLEQKPYEQIEARYHDEVVNKIKSVLAIADNFEAAMKDGRYAGIK